MRRENQMIVQRFEEMLKNAQFSRIDSNIPEMKMFYRMYSDRAYVFHVCDARRAGIFDKVICQKIVGQIQEEFQNKGACQVYVLSVVFTADLKKARELAESDLSVWIVDTLCNRLMIYEHQPSDFMGIREYFERILTQTPVEKPLKKKNRYFSFCNTSIVLLNVLIFIWMEIMGDTQDARYMVAHGAMYVPYMINEGQMYRLFTAMWQHFGLEHLAGNMIPLLLLGDNLERAVGREKYIAIYLVSGLGASMCSFLYNLVTASFAVAAGASGAIFGVIGALFYVVASNRGRLEDMTILRLGILIVYILYAGITTPGIDNAAHIGGLVIGVLMAMLLYQGKGSARKNEC